MQRYLMFLLIFYSWFGSANAADLWVDGVQGKDSNDGLSAQTAFRTIQAAADKATPNTTIHIQPGVYRETVVPGQAGEAEAPIIYTAEQGRGTVILRGSESTASLKWTPLTSNEIGLSTTVDPKHIIWADVSDWQLEGTPRFVLQLDESGQVVGRLTLAREPDWQVTTEWKYAEQWWHAEGGSSAAECDPATDSKPTSCDNASRSDTQLTDKSNDTTPAGIEAGNLTTLGDLSGATLFVMDTVHGHHTYRRNIVSHAVSAGQITVDKPAIIDDAAGLGWGSQYYVENHPALLDTSGEYWYDSTKKRLYLYSPTAQPPLLEVSKRQNAWELGNRSYIQLDGLVFEGYNESAIHIDNESQQGNQGNILRNILIHYVNRGLDIQQKRTTASKPTSAITDFQLLNSEVGYIDTIALDLKGSWENDSDSSSFTQAPISNVELNGNVIHHIGFHSDEDRGIGLNFTYPDKVTLKNNHIHHVAHHGVQFYRSIVQGSGTDSSAIKTGDVLLANNTIEKTCQSAVDCGAVKFWGQPPQHLFRNVLLFGNTIRYNYGWGYVAEQRKWWAKGFFGFGLYFNSAGGVAAYRNVFHNQGWSNIMWVSNWREAPMLVYNNLLANAYAGIDIWNSNAANSEPVVDTQIVNNLVVNNSRLGVQVMTVQADKQFVLNHNLYYKNDWGDSFHKGALSVVNDKTYATLADIQSKLPWEAQGVEGDPGFSSYDYIAEQQTREETLVDFQLTGGSAAIDKGAALPTALQALLTHFALEESVQQQGTALDIGPFEYSPPLNNGGTAINVLTGENLTTGATFKGFIVTATEIGNHLKLSTTEPNEITVECQVDPADIGKKAEVKMVGIYLPASQPTVPLYFMRQGAQWLPWNTQLSSLTNAQTVDSLAEKVEMDVFDGTFTGLPGEFTVFTGYLLTEGKLVFNGQQPIQFSVSE